MHPRDPSKIALNRKARKYEIVVTKKNKKWGNGAQIRAD
jgi:hypothetical protein